MGSTITTVPDADSDGYEGASHEVSKATASVYVNRSGHIAYFRFLPVIPTAVIVTGAKVTLTTANYDEASATSTIKAEDAADAPVLAGTTGELTNKTQTSASVGWAMPTFGYSNETYDTPDLASIVQELVDSYGEYDGTKGMAIMFNCGAQTGIRVARAYEHGLSREAVLTIEYRATGGNIARKMLEIFC